MRRSERERRDKQRRTYLLFFPANLDHDAIVAWLRAIAGTSSASTLAFELWSTGSGFQYRLKVPWQTSEYIMSQLQTQLPGLRYEQDYEPPHRAWTKAVELGLTSPGRPLDITETTPAAIVGSVRGVKAGEAVVIQIVIRPAKRSRPPIYHRATTDRASVRHLLQGNEADRDEITDRRAKLDSPNFQAVIRVASVAETAVRAQYLIGNVRNMFRGLNTHATKFVKRMATKSVLQRRIDHPATPNLFGALLSANELAALIGWPSNGIHVPGLPPTMSPVLPASDAVLREGLIIGQSTYPGHERPVAIGWDQALMHVFYGGVTGVDKSEALAHIGRQAMEAGHGLIMLEVAGSLYERLLDYIPEHRLEDVILLDLQDYNHPLGLNFLDQGAPLNVIDQLIDLFVYKYGSLGVWGQEGLYHGLRTIASTPGLGFVDLAPLMLPRSPEEKNWADTVTRGLSDPELRRYWQRLDNMGLQQQQQRIEPVISRIWQLSSRPELRAILGQSTSSFKLDEVLQQNKILLVNLKGTSQEAATLAATLLMNSLWHAIKVTPKDKPTFLLMDEFASFGDLPVDTEFMLAQARKHKTGMVLATQNLGQLKPGMKDAILANARNKIALQLNASDANAVIREFGKHLEADNFTHLQAYEAIAQVQTPSGVSSPMTIKTLKPGQRTGQANEAIRISREKYGRDRTSVLQDIEARHKPPATPNMPIIGSLE